ncbi:MAG: MotA/TolQ/ExbB proton channel family protein [Candidatus Eisenbacteria bacterium]|uniref:MotA/TolQ/ExbB proton channel family protein n=1 Tax=Eiseniibacteriota bacterium TaxID=2212470 RepID=A0A956RQ34_UNCEI|nr:MotA/TolQ/ExbB proton channel family protein [Candidatus Eisenbacteria bacterium]
MPFVQFVENTGPLFYPLALCSLLASTVTIERIFALRRSRVLPREIVEVVGAVHPGRDLSLAIEVCRRNPGIFADVIRLGLEQSQEPWEVVRDSLMDAGRQKTPLLERHLVWLQTIAQAAPLLGLLGTVLGMMRMFQSISVSGLGDPQALSSGISEAMITTALGLAIGIPTLVAYNVLSAKSETLIGEMEAHASHLVQQLRSWDATKDRP